MSRSILEHDDPVTHYAQQVASGEIIAGSFVRDACQRHLDDLVDGPERGLFWDLEQARYAIGFFPAALRLNGGRFEGKPFELEPFQGFIVGSIFGWKNEDTGYRRFQMVFVETGKGSGKSPLAAGIGLYGLMADNEERAEIYAAATKKSQADILFKDAVAMVDQSPELDIRLHRSGSRGKEFNLAYHRTNSFFRPIAADDGQSGPRPHMGLIDEVHEHKDGRVIEMMRAGVKFRDQPLVFMITNSGAGRKSVCWDYHEYTREVCAGSRKDDTFFGYISALDEGDDPFKDESCWIKANPALGVTIKPKYLRDQVTQARGMPSKESVVKRLNFCMWVEATAPWISYHVWSDAGEQYDQSLLVGRRCVGGLDLSSTTDLTSLQLAFEPIERDSVVRLVSYFWLPEEGLAEKAEQDRAPYHKWKEDGHLLTTPGKAVSKLFVLLHIIKLMNDFDIESIAYDRWRVEDLKILADDEGLTIPELIEFGQGYKDMGPAIDDFETKLLGDELKHSNNPVMSMCAANAVTDQDPAGNRKLAKDKAAGRIDGVVAGVMAVKSLNVEKKKKSPYETRGIRSL